MEFKCPKCGSEKITKILKGVMLCEEYNNIEDYRNDHSHKKGIKHDPDSKTWHWRYECGECGEDITNLIYEMKEKK